MSEGAKPPIFNLPEGIRRPCRDRPAISEIGSAPRVVLTLINHWRPASGFTLVELMVAIAIIGFVLTTSLAVFVDRERRLRGAEETNRVYQVLANEAEVLRTIPFGALTSLEAKPFLSDVALLNGLSGARTELHIITSRPTLARVEATIVWRGGARRAMVTIIRSDTGGDNLW